MLKSTPKYRALLFYILIISYVASSFPFPMFEAIHFFAHLEKDAPADYHFHSYHKHGHDHEHIALNILEQNNKDQKDDQLPKEFKKKVENTNSYYWPALAMLAYRIDNFKKFFPFSAPALEQISPPPERI